jgi:hypothetical protein
MSEEEHEITQREKDAWKASKEIKPRKRESLSREQTKVFLKLLSELRSPVYFERDLGLSKRDVEYYKRELNISSQDEARRMLKRVQAEEDKRKDEWIQENVRQQRDAERIANIRLQEFERKKEADRIARREAALHNLDPVAIKLEDKERQKRLESQELEKLHSVRNDWRLPLTGINDDEKINLFRNDIINHGISFCVNKYSASPQAIKSEAIRLSLKINWDTVKR